MVGAGPEDAGSVHQVSIVLDVDGEAAVLAVSEGRAEGRWGAVADARASRSADGPVVPVEIPKALRPRIAGSISRRRRPTR